MLLCILLMPLCADCHISSHFNFLFQNLKILSRCIIIQMKFYLVISDIAVLYTLTWFIVIDHVLCLVVFILYAFVCLLQFLF